MKAYCPLCETEADLDLVSVQEDITVRGENITVPATYLKCDAKGHIVPSSDYPDDPLELAYREFRRRHNMLQPEEIRDFRLSRGFTQRELSSLLGWGGATLSRYENGALQDEAHDRLLRLAMEPRNLMALIEAKPDALPDETLARITSSLMVRGPRVNLTKREGMMTNQGKYQGSLSIARFTDSHGPSGIIIELEDEVSGTNVLSARISLADFAEAVTGKSNIPITFDFWPQYVGWTREVKEEIIHVAHPGYEAGRVAIHAAQRKALAPFEVDGWGARGTDIGNQHRREHDLDRDGLAAYRVTFVRFVEPPKDESQTEEENDD